MPPRILSVLLLLAITTPHLIAQTPLETSIDLVTTTGVIHGSLMMPAGTKKMPVVLLLAGSGPTDRDGNSPAIKRASNSYRQLATALSSDGIASVRFDKRGVAASAAAMPADEALARFDMYIDDAVAWVAMLRKDKRFSTITIIGHSEGSLIGMIAARLAHADGFVSIAGAGQPIGTVLRWQLRPPAGPQYLQHTIDSVIGRLESGQLAPRASGLLGPALFRDSLQPYLISWMHYNPVTELAKLRMPVLLVQGTADIQVDTAQVTLLKAALPSAELLMVPRMNHQMKADTTRTTRS